MISNAYIAFLTIIGRLLDERQQSMDESVWFLNIFRCRNHIISILIDLSHLVNGIKFTVKCS